MLPLPPLPVASATELLHAHLAHLSPAGYSVRLLHAAHRHTVQTGSLAGSTCCRSWLAAHGQLASGGVVRRSLPPKRCCASDQVALTARSLCNPVDPVPISCSAALSDSTNMLHELHCMCHRGAKAMAKHAGQQAYGSKQKWQRRQRRLMGKTEAGSKSNTGSKRRRERGHMHK